MNSGNGNPPAPRGRARGRLRATSTSESPQTETSTTAPQTGPAAPPTSTSTSTPQTEPATPSPSAPQAALPVAPPQEEPTSQVSMEQLKTGGDSTQNPVTQPPSNVPTKYTYKETKPASITCKHSTPSGAIDVKLVTNYVDVDISASWALHQYMVTFEPALEPEQTAIRKGIFRNIAAELGGSYLFDGFMAFMVKEIPNLPVSYETVDKKTNGTFKITIDCHKAVDRKDPACFQIYNIFVRKCLDHLTLVEMGRRYYDEKLKTTLAQHFLEVWPGFATSLRYFENRLLLNLEIVNKVIRTKNTLEVMNDARQNYQGRDNSEEAKRLYIAGEVEGRIVMTKYNNHTYPIKAILWNEKPTDKFPCKDGSEMDYMTYYKTKYGLTIKNDQQPLLLAAPKEKEVRRGNLKLVKLVPETCVLTGLTDQMRSNFNLMKSLGDITHVKPTARVKTSEEFMQRLCGNTSIKEEMEKWNIHLNSTKLVRVKGKKLKEEFIEQQGKKYSLADFSGSKNFREKLHDPKQLKDWVLVVQKRQESDIDLFLNKLVQVSRTMGFTVGKPKIHVVDGLSGQAYTDKIVNAIKAEKEKLSLVFIVLPNNRADLYSTLKQLLIHEWGIPSQCCLPKNLKNMRTGQVNMSIVTKIAVQMSCKIGGVPWIIKNPLANKTVICVMGFDVYHSGSVGGGGVSYGAIVATTNQEFSKSCSFVSKHKHREEISSSMGKLITKCLNEFYKVNGVLPESIYFYRDGVGDGQVDIVFDLELQSALEAIKTLCKEKKTEQMPKLTYIIVSKRINTRFMVYHGEDSYSNPPSGTIVDDVVTLHYRYDFFLISQVSDDRQQGTVSPTSYNVIHDGNTLTPAQMQTFSYKLCHNYYNWTGTVSVPSVCQNAHKLAYITGEAIRQNCKEDLRHLPFYL